MTNFSKIDDLMKARNLKQNDLTNYLGVPKSNYTDWKNGKTSSYQKYLPQIAAFLNVDVGQLLDSDNDAYSFWTLLQKLCQIKQTTILELSSILKLSDSYKTAKDQVSYPIYDDISNISKFFGVPDSFLIECRPRIRVDGKLYQFSSSPSTWHISLLEDYLNQTDLVNHSFVTKGQLIPVEEEQKETPSEEGESVVIVSRSGKRFVHHLSPEQLDILDGMIDQMEKNNQ